MSDTPMRKVAVFFALVVGAIGVVIPATAQSVGPPATVEVVAKGTPAGGVWPTMTVYVNGIAASPSAISVDSSQYQTYSVTSTAMTADSTIDVVFENDTYLAPEDRNLYVASITANGQTVRATDAGVIVDRGSGAAAFDNQDTIAGQEGIWWNASIRFTVDGPVDPTSPPGTIEIVAKGEPAIGVWPEMKVLVNGVLASPGAIVVGSANYQTYTVTSTAFTDTSTVDVAFTNDVYQAPEDRNLYVQSIKVNGSTIESTDQSVIIDRGEGAGAFDNQNTQPGQAALWWPASLRFVTTSPVAPRPVNGQVTVRALGTFAAGDWPEMQVRVNGEIASPARVTVDNPAYEDFVFETSDMTDSPNIDVVFLNDGFSANGPGASDDKDRNLFVDSIELNGRRIGAADPRVTTDWGWGDDAFDGLETEPGRYALYLAGALRFDAYPVPEIPTPAPRSPLAGETIYAQDFAAGSIDTENWELYDQVGNAGWGLRRPSAFSVVDLAGARGGKAMKITADMGQGVDADKLISGGMILHPHSQTYGRYTMRIRTENDPDRVTTGVGLLWPDTSNPAPHNVWPTGGEVDWYEGWRDRLARKPIDLVTHYVIDGVHDADELSLVGPNGSTIDGSEWHTYQLDWRPDYLAVSVDGGAPNVITDDPRKIPQWNMKMTVQLDAWEPLDNPGQQPTISEPVSLWVDWITVERYPDLSN